MHACMHAWMDVIGYYLCVHMCVQTCLDICLSDNILFLRIQKSFWKHPFGIFRAVSLGAQQKKITSPEPWCNTTWMRGNFSSFSFPSNMSWGCQAMRSRCMCSLDEKCIMGRKSLARKSWWCFFVFLLDDWQLIKSDWITQIRRLMNHKWHGNKMMYPPAIAFKVSTR